MIAGRNLANQYGWKIGDKIPIASNIFPQKDGSKAWTFDLVGIYDGKDEEWQRSTNGGWINYAYFDEANQFGRGLRRRLHHQARRPRPRGARSQRRSTRMFENSPDETKTQTEKDFNIGFFKQIGDIGLIVRWILFAVFFTLLLVVGNTIAQSVRERIPELAILKTLGFSDGSVLGFVLAEAAVALRHRRARSGSRSRRRSASRSPSDRRQSACRGRRQVWLIGRDRDRRAEPRRRAAAGAARSAPHDRRRAGRALRRTRAC